MFPHARTSLALVVIAALCTAGVAAAQDDRAKLTGRVTDGSGAALPGVTVTATSNVTGQSITTVTDGVGQFLSVPIPADTYTITFELAGFETQTRTPITVRPGDVFILDQQLGLATLTESVEVIAAAPPPPAPPPPPPPPPPPAPPVKLEAPKRPEAVPVAKELLASVCGPGRASDASLTIGHLVAHRDEPNRHLYGRGDVLILDVGDDIGLAPGQNLVVRRRFMGSDRSRAKTATMGEQTAGLIQIVESGKDSSVAVVVYACGELFAGDTVEPFDALPMWTARGLGTPQYDEPARIILGEHGQTLGAERQLMVIDKGIASGAERGQRLTIFRRSLGDRGPVRPIADAIIVAVRAESATIRIERASDAVTVGDMVALHR